MSRLIEGLQSARGCCRGVPYGPPGCSSRSICSDWQSDWNGSRAWRAGGFPLPHFAAEGTPPLAECFAPFRAALEQTQTWADALTSAGTPRILVMLGQRFTPASVTDARGIAPTRTQLLGAASQMHTPSDPLTAAARALTKHVHRSPEKFWGEVRGSTQQKNAAAQRVLENILDNATWRNVFGHFAHELVYEARAHRTRGAMGARWDPSSSVPGAIRRGEMSSPELSRQPTRRFGGASVAAARGRRQIDAIHVACHRPPSAFPAPSAGRSGGR
jgi:hypothetical protein